LAYLNPKSSDYVYSKISIANEKIKYDYPYNVR